MAGREPHAAGCHSRNRPLGVSAGSTKGNFRTRTRTRRTPMTVVGCPIVLLEGQSASEGNRRVIPEWEGKRPRRLALEVHEKVSAKANGHRPYWREQPAKEMRPILSSSILSSFADRVEILYQEFRKCLAWTLPRANRREALWQVATGGRVRKPRVWLAIHRDASRVIPASNEPVTSTNCNAVFALTTGVARGARAPGAPALRDRR